MAAFLGGFLLGRWQREKHPSLRENFARVDVFQGRSYREVLTIAGAKPNSIVQKADGSFTKTWKEAGYSISLEFDDRDICLGVVGETY